MRRAVLLVAAVALCASPTRAATQGATYTSTMTAYQGGAPWSVGLTSGANTVAVSTGRLYVDPVAIPGMGFYGCTAPAGINVVTASSETAVFMLVNLSTNTKQVRLKMSSLAVDDGAKTAIFTTYIDPTVVGSSGTAHPVAKGFQNGVAAAQAQCYVSPPITASLFGTPFDVVPTASVTIVLVNDHDTVGLDPGHRLLVTAQVSGANTLTYVSLRWSEQ